MIDDVAILEEAGVPTGPARASVRPSLEPARVRAAIERLARRGVASGLEEPLVAWLRAVRDHWPSRWNELAGDSGEALLRALEGETDTGRTTKLRRIAIENLATWL